MERVDYRRFGWRYLAIMLVCVVPGLLAFALLYRHVDRGGGSGETGFIIAAAVFFASVGACMLADYRLRRSFRCPGCGERLRWPRVDTPGDPIDFTCERCQRTYVTGLHAPRD